MGMKVTTLSLLFCGALLTACTGSQVRNTFGLNRSAPDEFKVVSRPPLSVPPEFTLRPPNPGEAPLLEGDREKEAESLILDRLDRNYDEDATAPKSLLDISNHYKTDNFASGSADTALDPIMSSSLESAGESMFLSNAGADKADPNIRDVIYKDRIVEPVEEDDASPLERWLGLSQPSSVIDPEAEAERIKDNIEEGKPVNEGDVKTIDEKEDSVLDKLFD